MKHILIIDDDAVFCRLLVSVVLKTGEHEAECAHTLAEGLVMAGKKAYDVVFLDVMLPDGNGLDALSDLKKTASQPEVIVVTAAGGREDARSAIEQGAWDYIEKGTAIEKITLSLLRVLEYQENKISVRLESLKRDRIVGESLPLKACLDRVAQAAASDVNVLITGQTGTGKELFARTIHQNSLCSDREFVVVDCAAIPETLVESTLFGYEKGAFTGAEKRREGLVRLAHEGTLFLDEIGELPMAVQKSFLRVLQERRFRPVGGKNEIRSDFRLLSATNRDLEQMVRSGEFREDLFYRIRAVTIHLPTLSDRSDDIRPLAQYYLDKLFEKSGRAGRNISPAFFEMLEAYHWPGNVRELTHVLESAFAASFGGRLIPQHLPDEIRVHAIWNELNKTGPKKEATRPPLPIFREYRAAMTRKYLQELMDRAKGDIRGACKMSGFSRSRLYELMKQFNIRTRSEKSNAAAL